MTPERDDRPSTTPPSRQVEAAPPPRQVEAAPPPAQVTAADDPRRIATHPARPHTLVLDIGGTGTKMIVLDAEGRPLCDRDRELTPERAGPADILRLARDMARRQPPFDRVAVGFPGVVQGGVVRTAPNLDTETWPGTDLVHALEGVLSRPVRVVNDADLAGLGVVVGSGTELVLTLGTGMGSALFVDGHLVPNVELGGHPFKKRHSYEDRIGEAARRKVGGKRWRRRVIEAIELLRRTFSPDLIWIGGGNARRLDTAVLGSDVRIFDAVAGMRGGVRLWEEPSRFGGG